MPRQLVHTFQHFEQLIFSVKQYKNEDEGTKIVQNISNYLSVNKA
jgi:hypothetical protein